MCPDITGATRDTDGTQAAAAAAATAATAPQMNNPDSANSLARP